VEFVEAEKLGAVDVEGSSGSGSPWIKMESSTEMEVDTDEGGSSEKWREPRGVSGVAAAARVFAGRRSQALRWIAGGNRALKPQQHPATARQHTFCCKRYISPNLNYCPPQMRLR
jgi:hypothetical protein